MRPLPGFLCLGDDNDPLFGINGGPPAIISTAHAGLDRSHRDGRERLRRLVQAAISEQLSAATIIS